MNQATLGIISLKFKEKVVSHIEKNQQLKMTFDKEMDMTSEQYIDIFKKDIKGSKSVFAFVLEGPNAIKDWLDISRSFFSSPILYVSMNPDEIQRDINKLKNTEKTISTETTTIEIKSTIEPITTVEPVTTVEPITTGPVTTEPIITKFITTGPITAEPVSILPEVVPEVVPKVKKIEIIKDNVKPVSIVETTPPVQVKTYTTPMKSKIPYNPKSTIPISRTINHKMSYESVIPLKKTIVLEKKTTPFIENQEIKVQAEENKVEEKTNKVREVEPEEMFEEYDEEDLMSVFSHPSSCSSATAMDDHDAEVAAAMNSRYYYHDIIRRSFSPFPRPETPEVDQLRLKFEQIIHTTEPKEIRRAATTHINIKDIKPKHPVGTRVKSMVDIFMDEDRNKWEF